MMPHDYELFINPDNNVLSTVPLHFRYIWKSVGEFKDVLEVIGPWWFLITLGVIAIALFLIVAMTYVVLGWRYRSFYNTTNKVKHPPGYLITHLSRRMYPVLRPVLRWYVIMLTLLIQSVSLGIALHYISAESVKGSILDDLGLPSVAKIYAGDHFILFPGQDVYYKSMKEENDQRHSLINFSQKRDNSIFEQKRLEFCEKLQDTNRKIIADGFCDYSEGVADIKDRMTTVVSHSFSPGYALRSNQLLIEFLELETNRYSGLPFFHSSTTLFEPFDSSVTNITKEFVIVDEEETVFYTPKAFDAKDESDTIWRRLSSTKDKWIPLWRLFNNIQTEPVPRSQVSYPRRNWLQIISGQANRKYDGRGVLVSLRAQTNWSTITNSLANVNDHYGRNDSEATRESNLTKLSTISASMILNKLISSINKEGANDHSQYGRTISHNLCDKIIDDSDLTKINGYNVPENFKYIFCGDEDCDNYWINVNDVTDFEMPCHSWSTVRYPPNGQGWSVLDAVRTFGGMPMEPIVPDYLNFGSETVAVNAAHIGPANSTAHYDLVLKLVETVELLSRDLNIEISKSQHSTADDQMDNFLTMFRSAQTKYETFYDNDLTRLSSWSRMYAKFLIMFLACAIVINALLVVDTKGWCRSGTKPKIPYGIWFLIIIVSTVIQFAWTFLLLAFSIQEIGMRVLKEYRCSPLKAVLELEYDEYLVSCWRGYEPLSPQSDELAGGANAKNIYDGLLSTSKTFPLSSSTGDLLIATDRVFDAYLNCNEGKAPLTYVAIDDAFTQYQDSVIAAVWTLKWFPWIVSREIDHLYLMKGVWYPVGRSPLTSCGYGSISAQIYSLTLGNEPLRLHVSDKETEENIALREFLKLKKNAEVMARFACSTGTSSYPIVFLNTDDLNSSLDEVKTDWSTWLDKVSEGKQNIKCNPNASTFGCTDTFSSENITSGYIPSFINLMSPNPNGRFFGESSKSLEQENDQKVPSLNYFWTVKQAWDHILTIHLAETNFGTCPNYAQGNVIPQICLTWIDESKVSSSQLDERILYENEMCRDKCDKNSIICTHDASDWISVPYQTAQKDMQAALDTQITSFLEIPYGGFLPVTQEIHMVDILLGMSYNLNSTKCEVEKENGCISFLTEKASNFIQCSFERLNFEQAILPPDRGVIPEGFEKWSDYALSLKADLAWVLSVTNLRLHGLHSRDGIEPVELDTRRDWKAIGDCPMLGYIGLDAQFDIFGAKLSDETSNKADMQCPYLSLMASSVEAASCEWVLEMTSSAYLIALTLCLGSSSGLMSIFVGYLRDRSFYEGKGYEPLIRHTFNLTPDDGKAVMGVLAECVDLNEFRSADGDTIFMMLIKDTCSKILGATLKGTDAFHTRELERHLDGAVKVLRSFRADLWSLSQVPDLQKKYPVMILLQAMSLHLALESTDTGVANLFAVFIHEVFEPLKFRAKATGQRVFQIGDKTLAPEPFSNHTPLTLVLRYGAFKLVRPLLLMDEGLRDDPCIDHKGSPQLPRAMDGIDEITRQLLAPDVRIE